MNAAESPLTLSRMRRSSHREGEVLLQLSGVRYLTEPMIDDFPFGESLSTPLSRTAVPLSARRLSERQTQAD